jgi:bifunctional ADP-heptose synthase (sugar kinase/adenylyltransferase)
MFNSSNPLIIRKAPTKQDLLTDYKIQKYETIGNSVHSVKKTDFRVKIGLVLGRFDGLTPKDAVFLSLARTKCDMLIVAIDSDLSVRTKKETNQVDHSSQERAFLVASLPFVDWVYVYDEESPNLSIQTISPDMIFTGLHLNDREEVEVMKERIMNIEHPFDLTKSKKKKIPLKFFDIPLE